MYVRKARGSCRAADQEGLKRNERDVQCIIRSLRFDGYIDFNLLPLILTVIPCQGSVTLFALTLTGLGIMR